VSLDVYVWVPNDQDPGGTRIIDPPEGDSELAGFERTRTRLWGSEAARRFGATFLPRLAVSDLWVQPGEVELFTQECALLMSNLAVLSDASGYDEDYVGARLRNIIRAAERARQVGGGIVVW
jgi:hypothetical protein